jgi:hypothetical protein
VVAVTEQNGEQRGGDALCYWPRGFPLASAGGSVLVVGQLLPARGVYQLDVPTGQRTTLKDFATGKNPHRGEVVELLPDTGPR